ncbi:hypothetical protein H5410_033096 [Solanum commersonii]|uniref:SWIM-type domain-containing protein n=1 Tax=Solanum commersonii TaxID=4109 RepID=A0A9J5YS30_SOLCO|nr:hypothetical protein H5410_033096 [Solanum commersonii]
MASILHRDKAFKIKTYDSKHTCKRWNHHNKTITSSFIARMYVDAISQNIECKLSDFRDMVNVGLKPHVTLAQARKAKNAKKKALALIDGDGKEQFSILWEYCLEIGRSIPGTSMYMKLTQNEMLNKPYRFQRIYRVGFSGSSLKCALWAATSATTVEFFNVRINDIVKLDAEAAVWLKEKEPTEWSRSNFSPNAKCDILLNNMCESFNSMILDARDKPIITLLEKLRYLFMDRLQANRDKADRWNCDDIFPQIKSILHKNKKDTAGFIPKKSNEWNFEILGGSVSDIWAVDLAGRKCSCRKWTITGIPCKHAISTIWQKNDEVINYVND